VLARGGVFWSIDCLVCTFFKTVWCVLFLRLFGVYFFIEASIECMIRSQGRPDPLSETSSRLCMYVNESLPRKCRAS
jgi:hypothetical protein